ncbi:hypothetical protein [Polaromonas sp.]|uniref:hypothetical protein n=1 Tax=Polaromonas sp. TaxID=1869339 RepID=UPI0035678C60
MGYWPVPTCTANTSPAASAGCATRNGFYTLNPDLQLRAHHTGNWLPCGQWLNQPLVFTGFGIKTNEAVSRPDTASE